MCLNVRFFTLAFLSFFLTVSCVSRQKSQKKANLHHQKALSLMKKCQYPSALSQLQVALKTDDQNPVFHHSIALLYFQFKKYKKALKHLKTALEIKPDFTVARVHLGRVLIEEGQLDEGLKTLKLAKKDLTYRYQEKIHAHTGLAYYKKKNFLQAEQHFSVARVVEKEDCATALYHGQSLYFLKQYKKSLKILEPAKFWCQKNKLICVSPSFEPYFYSALIYSKTGQTKRALKNLKTFIAKEKTGPLVKKALEYQKLWSGI